jgi:4-hydroxy-3-methylbut-2-enyl diphosphate reductase
MKITIDDKSGFCFGVVNAIQKAEEELNESGFLYCLGDIVHNNAEVERLKLKGLEIINHEQFRNLKNCKVIIRAHGEPPETYKIAEENNIELIDASCKVVQKLQKRIFKSFNEISEKGQVVIFGKQGHAEVNGLVGQTANNAIVIKQLSDIEKLDFTKPIDLFSQTTMDIDDLGIIASEIKCRMESALGTKNIPLHINDTICRQVSNRAPHLKEFALKNDIIIFVSGKESSNGKVLYEVCKSVNPKTFFVTSAKDIQKQWLRGIQFAGICGATSTPRWLMEDIAKQIKLLSI